MSNIHTLCWYFFSIFRTFGGEPPSRARDVPCAIGIRREGRSYVSQTIVAHQFQEYRSGGVSADPGDQLFRGRQRGGQDQFHRRDPLPVDVQVGLLDDRYAERASRRGVFPARRELRTVGRTRRTDRLLVRPSGRQDAQTQRQGVRPPVGSCRAGARRDRLARRYGARKRCRRRTAPLSQRVHFAARPGVSFGRDALQRRAVGTEPLSQSRLR